MRAGSLIPVWVLGLGLTASASRGAEFKEVQRTVPLDADGTVSLETYKGSIDIQAWDRPEVQVQARIEPDPEGRDQAEKVQQTEIRVEGSGRRVRIESDYSEIRRHGVFGIFGDDGTLPFVRYKIQMPKNARLEVKDYKSESQIAGLTGAVEFDSYKGRIDLAGLEGPLRLETYKGEVHADFTRFEASRFETYKGEIEITLPPNAAFEIDADLGRRGGLSSDFDMAVRSAGVSGRHRSSVNGGGPRLSLETYKGSFRLKHR